MKHLLAFLLALSQPHQPAMKLSQYCGDSITHVIPLTWQGAAFTPGSDWTLIWTAKLSAKDDDAHSVIQKTTGAGISTTGGATNPWQRPSTAAKTIAIATHPNFICVLPAYAYLMAWTTMSFNIKSPHVRPLLTMRYGLENRTRVGTVVLIGAVNCPPCCSAQAPS